MSSFASFISEITEALLPTVAFADDEEENVEEEQPEEEEEAEEAGADDEEEEEDEDEDDDEPEDPYPKIREAAAEGVCHHFKHHFEECVERVTAAQQEPGYEELEHKEECVEEFFHLEHCINDNTAGSLFKLLK